jgi:hypothetical protein
LPVASSIRILATCVELEEENQRLEKKVRALLSENGELARMSEAQSAEIKRLEQLVYPMVEQNPTGAAIDLASEILRRGLGEPPMDPSAHSFT